MSPLEPHAAEDGETPEFYSLEIRAAFQSVAAPIDSAFSRCLDHLYPDDVSHVDLMLYPESFTDYFALYVWPIRGDRTVQQSSLELVFRESVEFKLPDRLDPYNVDYEWRSDLFFRSLSEVLHASWKKLPEDRARPPFYLMTPDSPRSWSIGECKWVAEEEKLGG